MATPNNTPNDSGRKSLTTHVWQTRRSVSKGSDKPKKDGWDKADIIGKFLIAFCTAIAAIVIPLVVAYIGGQVQRVVTAQNTGKDYMQIALNILEKKDLTQDMQKNIGLRQWAVGLLRHYSPVTLDDNTADKLVRGQVEIPLVVHGGLQDFPWNEKDTLIKAPHGGPFASVNAEGVVKLQTAIRTPTGDPGYIVDQSGIKSPNAYFSQNGEALFVYNKQKAAIYFTQPDTILGEQRLRPPIRISPPNGISQIWLSEDGKVGVTGTDNKQVTYDLDGNEIK